MRHLLTTAVFLVFVGSASAEAASLRVAPVLLDVTAPAGATALTLRNDEARPLNVQIRVFRWAQVNGVDRLEPTTDVVVSPPIATLAKGMEYVVRVVRTTPRPVISEESYRVIVDEIPDRMQRRNGLVNFVMRYSIPVFFAPPIAKLPKVTWSARRTGDTLVVTASNSGGRRLKISNVKLKDARGALVVNRKGLLGYVLNGTTMKWSLRGNLRDVAAKGSVEFLADSESGPISAKIALN